MAVIEMIQSRYKTKHAVRKVIDYIMDPEKTSPELRGGVFCSPDTAVNEFLLNKSIYGKESGRQVIHFTQSFAPTDNVSPEMAKEIADRLLTHYSFKGFQIAYAVHTNKAHLHTHFVINTVNYETGYKWQQSEEDLVSLKAFSDELCLEYGLSVVKEGQDRQMSREAYRTAKRGRSYIYETTLAVKAALAHADSKELFFKNMKALGYRVEWQKGRKDIMFRTPDGHDVYNKSLYPRGTFTKERMEQMLAQNVIGKREQQDFDKLLRSLERIKDECEEAGMLPLSYLREKEIRHAEQMETFVLASELFMELALEDNTGSATGDGSLSRRGKSIVQLKDYLAEQRKGRGLDFEHER